MHAQRLSRLTNKIQAHSLDALALVPGPNLFYLTGLSFHLSERPIVMLVPADASPTVVLPTLESVKVEHIDLEVNVFPYADEEGYEGAFHRACATLELEGCAMGAEGFRARLVEVQLLQRCAPGCQLAAADDVLAELRICKDEHELVQMRRAVAATEAALQKTMDRIETGMTESEIASRLRIELLRAGGGDVAFPPIVVAGPSAASPHATPSERPIQTGETIVVDCGATVGGYAADVTRTFAIGDLGPELAHVYEVVRAANGAGRAAVRPGAPAQDVDRAARTVIDEAGYGEYFIHRTGHGLGLEIHEPPYIVQGNEHPLEPGMTFTVEPGIYLPGRGGVRIEDDVLVTADGGESLTSFARELVAL